MTGINHRLGSRGTVNTAPVFGSGAFTPGGAPGAVGYLVGEPHQGLRYMFHMMNAARLGVGTGATGTAYAAYLKSLAYARERPQGRAVGGDVTTAQVPIVEHTDVRRMLLAQKSYVEGALALTLYCARLLDDEKTAPTEEERAEAAKPARRAHPDREVLALAVGPGEHLAGDPGARRRRLHPRPRRRAALARPAAQPHPRGHARHPGDGPARPQGAPRRRRGADAPGRPDGGHHRPRA
ncbi:acyl-CoA dehydrogenase family protein [Nocardioides convexus]|uniref:acyl-CoA dehydrogenase family protein n=1 Tax=Nocardioides convexus TaxID=2712224 RepID=UPI00241892F6|nr:acyl-CoA dehydrogenase family protein [Nocardioides convexus]